MKNLNPVFCFRKKISKLYYHPVVFIFQSFLSLPQLQAQFGDHTYNFYIFDFNKYWDQHYPKMFLAHLNTYVVILKQCSFSLLNSLLSNTQISVGYLIINNRFYTSLKLFNFDADAPKNQLTSFLLLQSYFNVMLLINQWKKVIFYFMFLLTNTFNISTHV